MLRIRLVAALAMSTIACAAFASGAAADTTISPSGSSGTRSCNPPVGDPQAHRCRTQAYGQTGSAGIDLLVGSAAGGTAPTAYKVEGLATFTNTATHPLIAPVPEVTYTWRFTVGSTSLDPIEVSFPSSPQGGSEANYVALKLTATHAGCATCTAITRTVLAGEDPDADQSGPMSVPVGTPVEIATTLTNTAGGDVPPGAVALQADLQGRSAWFPDPIFQGLAHVQGELTHESLVASGPGLPPPPVATAYVDETDPASDFDGTVLVCGEAANACETIQRGVDRTSTGGTVQVAGGTYREQVKVARNMTLDGAGAATVVKPPSTLVDNFHPSFDGRALLLAEGANVTIRDLAVDGERRGSPDCNFVYYGISYYDAGGEVSDTTVTGIRSDPHGDCFSPGIYLQNETGGARSWLADDNAVSDYGDSGIGAGASSAAPTDATITDNTVTGAGQITETYQVGIGTGNFIKATVLRNTVSDQRCDNPSYCGSDPFAEWGSDGIGLYNPAGGSRVAANTLADHDVGIYSWAPVGSPVIEDNTILNSRMRSIYIDEGTHTVTGNTITGGDVGVIVAAFDVAGQDSTANLTGNTITGAATGVEIADENPADDEIPVLNAHFNRIVSTTSAVDNTTGVPADAENNWWGCNGGPGQTGCAPPSGSVDFDPWLVLGATASPQSIPTGGATSNITASLAKNSNGVTPAGNQFPDGTTIGFSTDLGTVSPSQAGTANAAAVTTLTSGASPGTAHVAAVLDGQTATANVQIVQQSPPATTPPAAASPPASAVAGKCKKKKKKGKKKKKCRTVAAAAAASPALRGRRSASAPR